MNTAGELERWLRKEANDRIHKATSRRNSARAGQNLTDEDRKVGHAIAEQMLGRKLPKTSRVEEENNTRIQERIASQLDHESAMIIRFADWVASVQAMQISDNK